MTLSEEARRRLDAHLDAVEQALATAGNSREQRRAVVDDLESQINEMLAARSDAEGGGGSPTLADVEAVLAQVDPPAAYGNAAGPSEPRPSGSDMRAAVPPPIPGADAIPVARMIPAAPASVAVPTKPRYSRAAIWGLVCIVASVVPWVILLPFMLMSAATTYNRLSSARVSSGGTVCTIPAEGELVPLVVPRPDGSTVPAEATPSTAPVEKASRKKAAARNGDTVRISPGSVQVESGGDRVEVSPTGVTVQSEGGPMSSSNGNPVGAAVPSPSKHIQTKWSIFPCFACTIWPLGLLGTVLGWVAFFQIRASRGALCGMPLALFDGLFYPVMLVLFLMGYFARW
ncbi:MAG: hypothetical protein FWD61_11430 [Phycisphaerales bacterium]|nr:hypothetical protein [Phycisphaerales bacterium]